MCQLSNFPNSCIASSLLQEDQELSFLCLARERSLQQMTRTMLTSCMSDSGSLEERKPLQSSVPSRPLMELGAALAFSIMAL